MSNLNGILIEYFLTGAFSLIWLQTIYNQYADTIKTDVNDIIWGAILVSIVYITGMTVDFLGKLYTDIFDKTLSRINPVYRVRKFEITCSQAEVFAFNPELGKQLEMRSSRDRIARGAIINCIIITLVLLFYTSQLNKYCIITGGILSVVLLTFMWVRFQNLSNKFLYHCQELLNKNS